MFSVLKADQGALATKLFHYSSWIMPAAVPLALYMGPCMPLDLTLGLLLPIHGHIGMNYVVTDYAPKILPKSLWGPTRYAVLGVTLLSILGLTKLNLEGPGISATIKGLWRVKPEEAEK
eukprot:CAMPEP_0113934276 /NCGR_PEP_ID=MMETSP1339-20121228/1620_1 /TAXON_ID=94617 /ORGANISM="Fibrocapsa japonica" /LENGTH=118 /DNA_ID=CAMNT_0000936005 /DNA_START=221 /DNA_END=577 /DNA_ORIENTATION=+ /assembly_acc=CAM_ASM_000762